MDRHHHLLALRGNSAQHAEHRVDLQHAVVDPLLQRGRDRDLVHQLLELFGVVHVPIVLLERVEVEKEKTRLDGVDVADQRVAGLEADCLLERLRDHLQRGEDGVLHARHPLVEGDQLLLGADVVGGSKRGPHSVSFGEGICAEIVGAPG